MSRASRSRFRKSTPSPPSSARKSLLVWRRCSSFSARIIRVNRRRTTASKRSGRLRQIRQVRRSGGRAASGRSRIGEVSSWPATCRPEPVSASARQRVRRNGACQSGLVDGSTCWRSRRIRVERSNESIPSPRSTHSSISYSRGQLRPLFHGQDRLRLTQRGLLVRLDLLQHWTQARVKRCHIWIRSGAFNVLAHRFSQDRVLRVDRVGNDSQPRHLLFGQLE